MDSEESRPLLAYTAPSSPPPSSPTLSAASSGGRLSPRSKPSHGTSVVAVASSSSSSSSDPESGSTPLEPPATTRSVEDDVQPESSPLGRTITWSSAFALTISRVIGSGIFATPGAILVSAGSPGLALTLWVAGALIAACGLSVALEYGCMLPRSGGDKVYLEFTYRRPRFLASTLVAVQAVVLGFTASNCVVFGRYTLFALGLEGGEDEGGTAGEWARRGVAVGLLTVITAVHGITPRLGVKIQDALSVLKVGMVVFMVLAGLWVVAFGRPGPSDQGEAATTAAAYATWDSGGLWAGTIWNWGAISTALFKVFYSYAGLENVNNVLNEVKDPVRTLKSVTTFSLVTACVLYLLVNVAYFLVVPLDEIRHSGELVGALFFQHTFGGSVGRRILPLAVALSAAGNVMVVVFAMARLKQEIARQGFLPFSDLLSSTRPFGSPLGGLLVHYLPSVLVIVLPPSKEVYSFILEVEGYPAQFYGLAIGVGLIWLRFKRPDLKRPFKAWIPGVVLKILLSLALLTAPFFPPEHKPEGMFYATYAIVGVSIIIFGILYWYLWTILLPRLQGYKLEEETVVLKDGISITKLVHVPR